ncbi:structural maintenance of chromosomes protein 4-like isoform X1 [Poeciliopsis prolifica]|uniref:structural maintenance of chromosomes protein 4-like isoform X1 n=1 Tax=Poeciliopsis prolifica TaxID=188132 RepID=UPI00241358D1|nr:structural maintenance of chromosomes protein 4-like isoform X1 [Poeciliopsis prolifica]XP_054899617.1 structural maintenance of chromosomes protein 4-like isoform X1 [Poeciliopsis prolifica]
MEEAYIVVDDEDPAAVEIKDLMKRYDLALKQHRLTKELYEKLVDQGQITEELMGEMEQENQNLTNKIKELREQTENEKLSIEKNKELMRQRDLEEKKVKIREMEDYLQKMKEENQLLAVELEELSKNHQEETAENIIKENQRILAALHNKDAQIERLSEMECDKKKKIDRYVGIIEELRDEIRLLEKNLKDMQEEQILTVVKYEPGTEVLHSVEEDDYKDDLIAVTSRECPFSWLEFGVRILKRGVMAVAYMILFFILFVVILVLLVSSCNVSDSNCNLWMVAFEFLEPYGEVSYVVTPVF